MGSSDKMGVQNFFDFELKLFGKFVRVDINSYHGSEHFCTMTSFRVFGVSEYEFLHIIDNEAGDTRQSKRSAGQDGVGGGEPAAPARDQEEAGGGCDQCAGAHH